MQHIETNKYKKNKDEAQGGLTDEFECTLQNYQKNDLTPNIPYNDKLTSSIKYFHKELCPKKAS